MDIVTQGIAGAVLAQTGANRQHKTAATLIGFLAGLLPDADILIRSAEDPLLNLEFHRQFSHSLLFIPIGAGMAALLLWPFFRKHLPIPSIYLFSLLGYSIGGLLDACTSFGTQLLWPFSDTRIAWNLIAVVDPVFTLGLLAGLLMGWRTGRRRFPALAVGFACLYLAFAYLQQQFAMQAQQQLINQRGHNASMAIVKPSLGNVLLWRSVYRHHDHYYVDAIRVGIWNKVRLYPGDSIPAYAIKPHQNEATASRQTRDIIRFGRLSQGYLVQHPRDRHVIGDIRYAMLPNSIEPLWGVRLNPGNQQAGVEEATFRKSDTATRKQFTDMLLGK